MIAESHLQSNVDKLGDYLSYGSVGNEEKGIPPDVPSREEMELAADAVLSELRLEEA
jgi:hypothetical protein